MRKRLVVESLIAGIVCGVLFVSNLAGQSAPAVPLQEQLNAQYKLAKIGGATGGRTVVETGTILDVKKGGIVGVAQFPKTLGVCPSKYEAGDLKGPSSCAEGYGGVGAQNIRLEFSFMIPETGPIVRLFRTTELAN